MIVFSVVFAKATSLYFAFTSCSHPFFFFPNWWEYLKPPPTPPTCAINFDFPGDIWLVGLALLEILLRLAGFLAVISIIIAGIRLVTSEGSSEKTLSARNRVLNSLLGLAIASVAAAVVGFIGHSIPSNSSSVGLPDAAATDDNIRILLNIIFVIIGALAFLAIVLAGFRYIYAGSDANRVATAKKQILYAAAGLILVALAASIVNFVLGKL